MKVLAFWRDVINTRTGIRHVTVGVFENASGQIIIGHQSVLNSTEATRGGEMNFYVRTVGMKSSGLKISEQATGLLDRYQSMMPEQMVAVLNEIIRRKIA